jgi:heterodisulfide reductase subunit C
MLKIKRENLRSLYEKLANEFDLFAPIKSANEVNYAKYTSNAEVSIDTLKTVKSPKNYFFPMAEDMMGFKMDKSGIKIIDVREEVKPFIIFGVRACDLKSFEILDKVFLAEPVDTYYKARRDAGIIITHACNRPLESCFCSVFKIDASAPKGDITMHTDKSYAYFTVNTPKGQSVIDLVKDLFETCDENAVQEIKENIKSVLDKLPYKNLNLENFTEENLNKLFNSDKWQGLSEACLGCGTCTFVCPTCQCFDIRDHKTKDGFMRFRCWDSCMYSDFTLMAHGNNRTTQLQRYRQRFMHKLVYYPSQYDGTKSCVGCGRCVDKCPQNLNIIKVILALGEEK